MGGLAIFKHLIFSWGMDTNKGVYSLNNCSFTWSQLAMFIEFLIEEEYQRVWIPAEWLTFERFLNTPT